MWYCMLIKPRIQIMGNVYFSITIVYIGYRPIGPQFAESISNTNLIL